MKIYISLETKSLFACAYVWERASESERDGVRVRFTTAAAFTRAGTGEGQPEQNEACANVTHLWPSARQTGLLPGNKSLCSPGPYGTGHIYISHA